MSTLLDSACHSISWGEELWEGIEEFEEASASLSRAYDDARWAQLRARVLEVKEALARVEKLL